MCEGLGLPAGAPQAGGDLQAGGTGEGGLTLVKSEKFFWAEMERGGDMQHVEGTIALSLGVRGAETLGDTMDIRPIYLTENEGTGGEIGVELGQHARRIGAGPTLGAIAGEAEGLKSRRLAELQQHQRRKGDRGGEFSHQAPGGGGIVLNAPERAEQRGIGEEAHPS